ncbi:MAG: hypothetical protein Ct9H90mP8_3140 [Pseudomonadota bacterium]|nr:MAG: hypothetical protein Ct9H90mP8_3140 [Pseudomonadota bacterium]
MPTRLPSTADAVILGGGVMGASTAYHLCKAGIQKVVLLEREPFLEQVQPAVVQEASATNSIPKSISVFLKSASRCWMPSRKKPEFQH